MLIKTSRASWHVHLLACVCVCVCVNLYPNLPVQTRWTSSHYHLFVYSPCVSADSPCIQRRQMTVRFLWKCATRRSNSGHSDRRRVDKMTSDIWIEIFFLNSVQIRYLDKSKLQWIPETMVLYFSGLNSNLCKILSIMNDMYINVYKSNSRVTWYDMILDSGYTGLVIIQSYSFIRDCVLLYYQVN